MELRFDDIDNLFSTTLSSAISDSDTTIYLNSVPTNATEGFLVIDADNSSKREVVYFNAVGANYVSCPASNGRGQAGTSATSHNSGATVKMNVLREHIKPLRDIAVTGWNKDKNTWTYASATTFTVSGDQTSIFTKGTKIKLTNDGSTKYFYVTDSSYSTNTTVTITGGTDYTLASGAITNPYYSYVDNPQGFPHWFAYNPTLGGITEGNGTKSARFCVNGRTVTCVLKFTLGSTSSVTSGITVSVPIDKATGNVDYMGVAWARDISDYSGSSIGAIRFPDDQTTNFVIESERRGTSWDTDDPLTWSNGDILHTQLTYEI